MYYSKNFFDIIHNTNIHDFVIGATIVPLFGLITHFCAKPSNAHDYSLHNRFETAYCFNTPQSHTKYIYYPEYKITYIDERGNRHIKKEYSTLPTITPYMASPWATYPAMLILGSLGTGTGILIRAGLQKS